MKLLLAILSGVYLIGCSNSGGGGGSSASTVNGTDFSGTYMLNSIQCVNSALTVMNNSTTYSGNFSSTIVVTGNSFTETMISGSCTINLTGNIVINSSGMTLTGMTLSSVTGGSCNFARNLNGTVITPTSSSTTYTTGPTLSNASNATYIWNATTKAFGVLSIYSDGVSPYCFIVYTKQ